MIDLTKFKNKKVPRTYNLDESVMNDFTDFCRDNKLNKGDVITELVKQFLIENDIKN